MKPSNYYSYVILVSITSKKAHRLKTNRVTIARARSHLQVERTRKPARASTRFSFSVEQNSLNVEDCVVGKQIF